MDVRVDGERSAGARTSPRVPVGAEETRAYIDRIQDAVRVGVRRPVVELVGARNHGAVGLRGDLRLADPDGPVRGTDHDVVVLAVPGPEPRIHLSAVPELRID